MLFRSTAILLLCLSSLLFDRPIHAQSVSATGPADDPTRQTEGDWVDDRWSKTDLGQFLRATIDTPGQRTPHAIAIKVGANNEAAVCFDTDLLRYSAAWTAGFVRTHGQRYGLISPLTPVGEIQFGTASVPGWASNGSLDDPRPRHLGPLPRTHAKYKGLYLHGQRVILSYTVGDATVLDSPGFHHASGLNIFTRTLELSASQTPQLLRVLNVTNSSASLSAEPKLSIGKLASPDSVTLFAIVGENFEPFVDRDALNVRILPRNSPATLQILVCTASKPSMADFKRFAQSITPESLTPFTRGGPSRWGDPLITKGQVDRTKGSFAVDTITIPYENPWNALFFAAGHDFFNNGDAAVAAIHGDIWRVSGLEANLEKITWKRFATGLYQPLGLKIINDKVHVLERDQITILHDLNEDGEADFYENFNNDCIGAGGGHSYTTSLETDSAGNFYFTKCAENTPHGGTALKVPKDGFGIEVVATGFRNPNGMGVGPGDIITVADQQGDWVPETRLDAIQRGGFYGFTPMHKRASAPTTYDPPLVWIPRSVDNSAGGQVWVPENTWGSLAGQMLHLSFGRCTMMMILRDSNEPTQGAVVPLPGRFASGVCRGRFNPRDGHLYVTGLRGWQTAAVRDGCFQRVRYQKPSPLPMAYTVTGKEVSITFSEPLDRELAEDIESYGAETWNYKWTSNYGSPDFSVANPEKQGRDALEISKARLDADSKTVVLTLPTLQKAMQLAIRYNLETTDGEQVQNTIFATLNKSP